MATDTVKAFKDAVLKISDAGGSAGMDTITVAMGEGALSWTVNTPVRVKKNRGTLDHALLAEEEPLAWSIDAEFRGLLGATGTANASTLLYEALQGQSSASDWNSDEPNSDVHAVIIELVVTDPGDATTETITIPRAFCESLDFNEDTDGDTLAASGRAMVVRPTVA